MGSDEKTNRGKPRGSNEGENKNMRVERSIDLSTIDFKKLKRLPKPDKEAHDIQVSPNGGI